MVLPVPVCGEDTCGRMNTNTTRPLQEATNNIPLNEQQRQIIVQNGISPFSGFKINTTLQRTLSVVGATDQTYTFIQIHKLVIAYLLKNRHLIDRTDCHYINCENDPLAIALGVERFHSSELKHIISKNVILVKPYTGQPSFSSPPKENILQDIKPLPNSAEKSNSHVSSSNVNNSVKSCSSSDTATKPRSKEASDVLIDIPFVPSPASSDESIHSFQGYVTEIIRNTEPESSSSESSVLEVIEPSDISFTEYEEVEEVEEYEPVSDDQHVNLNSDDTSSDIEDVKTVAVVALLDESEENSFADIDDSDYTDMETQVYVIKKRFSDRSTQDEDPELENDKWPCIMCGILNEPYMRYCLKCWQMRKNWLPDRPIKRRKRKPRPKKRSRTRSLQQEVLTPEDSNLFLAVKEEQEHQIDSASICGSQDSGVGLSQDLETDTCGPGSVDISNPSTSTTEITNKTLKRSHVSNAGAEKCAKKQKVDDNSSDEANSISDFVEQLKSKKKWLKSHKGKKLLDEILSKSESEEDVTLESNPLISMCTLCCMRPKNASIIHGRTSHQTTCYPCAKKLYDSRYRCPVCCRKIHMITKHFVV